MRKKYYARIICFSLALTCTIFAFLPAAARDGVFTLAAESGVYGTSLGASGVYMAIPAGETAEPGDTVSYDFVLTNNYSDNLTIDISVDSVYTATIRSGPTAGVYALGHSATIIVEVEVPADAEDGDRDDLTLTAAYTALDGSRKSGSGTVTTTVNVADNGNGNGNGDGNGDGDGDGDGNGGGNGGGTGGGRTTTRSSGSGSGSSGTVWRNPNTVHTPSAYTPEPTQWMTGSQVGALLDGDAYRSRSAQSFGIKFSVWENMEAKPYIHSTTDGPDVQVRLTIPDASRVRRNLLLSGYVKGAQVNSTRTRFEKWFTNKVAIIAMEQESDWGQEVRIAAKVDLSGMDTQKLKIYAYDSEENKYYLIEKPDYHIDNNGYLHFNAEKAGAFVITDSALNKR